MNLNFRGVSLLFAIACTSCMISLNTQTFASNSHTTTINVEIPATIISVTLPLDIRATINPNIGADGLYSDAFISPEFSIINDTNSPINVRVDSITPYSSNMLSIIDKDTYTDEEWAFLSRAQSEANIALGFKAVDSSMMLGTPFTEYWLADDADALSGFLIGTLKPLSTITFEMVGKHGMTFSDNISLGYQVQYVVELK